MVEHVRQHDFPHVLHVAVVHKLRIEVEKDRHVHLLAWPQLLLLEAEALDLVEVLAHLCGRHVVYRHAGDSFITGGRCTVLVGFMCATTLCVPAARPKACRSGGTGLIGQ